MISILKSGLFWIEVKQKNDGMKCVLAEGVSARWSPCSVTLKALCLWRKYPAFLIHQQHPPPPEQLITQMTNTLKSHLFQTHPISSLSPSFIQLLPWGEDKEILWSRDDN